MIVESSSVMDTGIVLVPAEKLVSEEEIIFEIFTDLFPVLLESLVAVTTTVCGVDQLLVVKVRVVVERVAPEPVDGVVVERVKVTLLEGAWSRTTV
jgi:hypothetical protein